MFGKRFVPRRSRPVFSSDLQFIFVLGSGVVAFLFQFGALMWRIAGVERAIHDRIAEVEIEAKTNAAQVFKDAVSMELRITERFLTKESFGLALASMDSRLIRLEGKLDAALASAETRIKDHHARNRNR